MQFIHLPILNITVPYVPMRTNYPPHSGKRILTLVEARYLASAVAFRIGKPIPVNPQITAEEFLYWFLMNVVRTPSLHAFWVQFIDSQMDCLSLHTPENHYVSDDIHYCVDHPGRRPNGDYSMTTKYVVREEAVRRYLRQREEASISFRQQKEALQIVKREEPVLEDQMIPAEEPVSVPIEAAGVQTAPQEVAKPAPEVSPFDWSSFKAEFQQEFKPKKQKQHKKCSKKKNGRK